MLLPLCFCVCYLVMKNFCFFNQVTMKKTTFLKISFRVSFLELYWDTCMSCSGCIRSWSFSASLVSVIPLFSVCLIPWSWCMESYVLSGNFARDLCLGHAGQGRDGPRPGFYGPHAKNGFYIFKGWFNFFKKRQKCDRDHDGG